MYVNLYVVLTNYRHFLEKEPVTVNFYIDKASQNPERTIFAYVRGIGDKKTIVLHTGEKVNAKYWDSKKQQARRGYVGSPELNTSLSSLKEDIKKCYRNLLTEQKNVALEDVREAMKKLVKNRQPLIDKKDFSHVLDEFIQVRESEKSKATIRLYKVLRNHLMQFQKAKKVKLSFHSIDLTFYDAFTTFLTDKLSHTNNTVGKYLATLKTFLRWSADRGYNDNLTFVKFKIPTELADIVTLTEEELLQFYYTDFTGNKTFEHVRDVFCFGCFTGQRFTDIKDLGKNDVRGDTWYLRPAKTKDILQIPLNDYALEILEKYKDSEKPLPVISIQKTNEYLKQAAEIAQITEPIKLHRYRAATAIEYEKPKHAFISTHTARRTFVTLSLEKGMRPETVMEITGHKDYKTFKKYIKLTSKVKAAEMRQIWKKAQ